MLLPRNAVFLCCFYAFVNAPGLFQLYYLWPVQNLCGNRHLRFVLLPLPGPVVKTAELLFKCMAAGRKALMG